MYLFCKSVRETAKLDFEECLHAYFSEQDDEMKPKILFSFYYSHVDSNQRVETELADSTNVPSNLHVLGGSKVELDFDFHAAQAEKIFRKICPTEEFLPKPPAQEDIIFGDNESSNEHATTIKEIDLNVQTDAGQQSEPLIENSEVNMEQEKNEQNPPE